MTEKGHMERPVTASRGQKVIPTEDRRRYPRVEVAWDVTVESGPRVEWQGEIVSFGPFGMRVRLPGKKPSPSEGSVVRVRFAPLDESPLSIEGVVCRVDPDGLAITFVNLSSRTFDRLKSFVDTLLRESG